MKLTLLLVISCLSICTWVVDGWFVTVNVETSFRIDCNDCEVHLGRKKRSIDLSPCDTVYPQKFVNYDLNDDKKITLEELAEIANCTKGEMSSVFDKTDTNDDGYIDRIEFQFASFSEEQKDHAIVENLKQVGEWVSDSVDYMNKHGLKTVTLKITKLKKNQKDS